MYFAGATVVQDNTAQHEKEELFTFISQILHFSLKHADDWIMEKLTLVSTNVFEDDVSTTAYLTNIRGVVYFFMKPHLESIFGNLDDMVAYDIDKFTDSEFIIDFLSDSGEMTKLGNCLSNQIQKLKDQHQTEEASLVLNRRGRGVQGRGRGVQGVQGRGRGVQGVQGRGRGVQGVQGRGRGVQGVQGIGRGVQGVQGRGGQYRGRGGQF
jgi:hypothetical protein